MTDPEARRLLTWLRKPQCATAALIATLLAGPAYAGSELDAVSKTTSGQVAGNINRQATAKDAVTRSGNMVLDPRTRKWRPMTAAERRKSASCASACSVSVEDQMQRELGIGRYGDGK